MNKFFQKIPQKKCGNTQRNPTGAVEKTNAYLYAYFFYQYFKLISYGR